MQGDKTFGHKTKDANVCGSPQTRRYVHQTIEHVIIIPKYSVTTATTFVAKTSHK